MKSPLTLILILAASGMFYSCKKDAKPNEGTILMKVESRFSDGSSTRRNFERNASDKITWQRDWSSAYLNGEVVMVEYGTDNKLKTVNFHDKTGSKLFYHELEYNVDGRVSKRMTKPGTVNIADDYHIYGYDAAGHLVVDSQYSRISSSPIIHDVIAVTKFIYTGNNVSEVEQYRGLFTLALEYRMKYEYDNAVNPYRNMEGYYFMNEAGSAMFDIRWVSSNNVVKEYSADGNGAYQLVQSYKYTYNSSNHPWKSKPEINLSQPSMTEAEYFYEK